MKKIYTSIILVLATITLLFSQVPEAFNYQAVVRNSSGEIITNTNVAFRISILQGSETGTPVYVETHSVNTNNFGLVNLQIGKGTVTQGVFMPGNWGSASHFIKVEFDKDGGTGYVHLGTSPLLSVPYAFHAQTVAEDQVDDADADATNEIQSLQLSGTQLTLSKNGGTVTLPSSGGGGDNWGTQSVTSNATLSGRGTEADPLKVENSSIEPEWANIANKPAGFADGEDDVNDVDADPNNEIQTLSISGNDLTISDGNTVALPEGTATPWQTSGNDIFFNSGNVGIGNSNPEQKLQIDGNLKVNGRVHFKDGTNGIYIGATANVMQIGFSDGSGSFGNSNYSWGKTEFNGKLIAMDGSVGIGTENPREKLHVFGNARFMETGGGLTIAPNVDHVSLSYTNSTGIFGNSTFYWGKTEFQGNFVIKSGNVGIGEESPEQLLHIVGENPRILIEASSSNPEINFKNTGDIASSIWSIYKNGSNGDLHFYQNGNKLTLQKNTGNVGIGTTTPQGKLDVNGTIYQRGGVLHADYVFEENYKLETIEEHADFMWKNKHLPAIPKATVDENGVEVVEVGSHRKGIVEELEKAHIYISQLEKAIQEQAAVINGQGSRLERLESLIKAIASK